MFRKMALFLLLVTTLVAAEPKGTLVIMGGGKINDPIIDALVDAAGGKGAVIGILPLATSEDPESHYKAWEPRLKQRGAKLVKLNPKNKLQASDPALLEKAKTCTGFWFPGGDQNLITEKMEGTPLHALLKERYEQGQVVGGTSAGAAIMSDIMLKGTDDLKETKPGTYETRKGLGFLPGCIVDQHFLVRMRHNRLLSLAMDHPHLMGLGIDEETALVVKEDKARVVGLRRVLVLDPAGMKMKNGAFSGMKVHLIGPGQGLELKSRRVLESE